MKAFLVMALLGASAGLAAAPLRTDDIVLSARDATIVGDAKLWSSGYVGSWHGLDTLVVWTSAVVRAGTYRVVVEYACGPASEGTAFDVHVGSQKANGVVAATGGWGVFTNLDLGPVVIRATGPVTVKVAPTRSPKARSMLNLRSVALRREP